MRVIATASRAADWCRKLGADDIINHHEPFQQEFRRIGASEVDYVFCLNSTDTYIQHMADVVKPQGKVCTIVETRPGEPQPVSAKERGVLLELMFTRALFETPDMQAQHDLLNEASALLESGTLRTTQTHSFGVLNADNLRKAHAAIEKGDTIGKVTLRLGD
jgi:NADPH:quinone reductase-like Zn-dependent oxidoreductase